MAELLRHINVVVTGGTGFLGQEVIRQFLREGARVVTNYRSLEKMTALRDLVGHNPNLFGIQANLTREEKVEAFFSEAIDLLEKIDVVLHLMGGFWMGGEISETPVEKWNEMMELNLHSTFLVARRGFALMKERGEGGKIFTVGAQAALELPANMGAYSVSKAAVLALTQVLAREGRAYKITVNAILPSIIDTPANRASMPEADYSRWITPEEIASVLVSLCRPEASGLSGTLLKMYGKL